jgi:hypothetical protein
MSFSSMPALITLRGVCRPWRPSLLPRAATSVEHGALQVSVSFHTAQINNSCIHAEIRLVSLVQRQALLPCQLASLRATSITESRACLVPHTTKKVCTVSITSNLATHAWSTKCRRKKKLITQFSCKSRDKSFEPN